jgi:hypothetical protein
MAEVGAVIDVALAHTDACGRVMGLSGAGRMRRFCGLGCWTAYSGGAEYGSHASSAWAAYITPGPAPMSTAIAIVSSTSWRLAPSFTAALAWWVMQASQRTAAEMANRMSLR